MKPHRNYYEVILLHNERNTTVSHPPNVWVQNHRRTQSHSPTCHNTSRGGSLQDSTYQSQTHSVDSKKGRVVSCVPLLPLTEPIKIFFYSNFEIWLLTEILLISCHGSHSPK